jgi:hypothetical protein
MSNGFDFSVIASCPALIPFVPVLEAIEKDGARHRGPW